MNLGALIVVLVSASLYLMGYKFLAAQAKRKSIVEPMKGLKRAARKSGLSKKKMEIAKSMSSTVRRRITSITFLTMVMPLMLFVISTLIVDMMGIVAVESPYIIPEPFGIEVKGRYYIYSTWLCLLTYFAFSPLYLSIARILRPER